MEATLVLLVLLTGVSAVPKVWIPNTNYNNPGNWARGRLPKAGDLVIFPPDLGLGLTLPKGVTVLRQVVLPVNGELFLPETGVLTITGDQTVGEDVEWKRRGASAWLDPSNWRSDAEDADAPVPHMERLPCSADTVVFPPNSSFLVQLPEVAVPVGTVQLGGAELTSASWKAWLRTEPGFRQFIRREEDRATAVSVKELSMCTEKSGCVCGEPVSRSPERLLQEVCKYARGSCQEDVLCYSPIKPDGHCCDICGGYLILEIKASEFDIDALRQRLNRLLSNGDFPGVSGHVGRTSNTHAQIVVVDRPGQYEGVSVRLAGVLKDDIINSKLPGVLSVQVHTSGRRLLGSALVSATTTLMSTLFAVVIFMAIVYLLFVAYPSESRFSSLTRFREFAYPFQFARFENLSGEGEGDGVLQLGCEAVAEEDVDDPTRQAFDNPLYGQAKDEPEAVDEDRPVTFVHPVYSELQLMEKSKGGEDEVFVETADDEDEDTDTETEEEGGEEHAPFDEIPFGSS